MPLLVRQGNCSSYFLHFRVRTTRHGDQVVDPTGMHKIVSHVADGVYDALILEIDTEDDGFERRTIGEQRAGSSEGGSVWR